MHLKFSSYMASAVVAWGSSAAFGAETGAIELQGSIAQCSPSTVVLAMRLKNVSSETMELYKSDLPWGIQSSLILGVATNTSDPRLIKPVFFIDDPGPSLILIRASEVTSGDIDLLRRFPNLSKELRTRDLIVFWSYQAVLKDGEKTPRVTGSALIEKRQCGK